jgi:hypothetical protein
MPMLVIPDTVLTRFDAVLDKRAVAPALRADFKKWLRYFLDFCSKYPVPDIRSDQVRLFIDKLREKGQTKAQQEQAAGRTKRALTKIITVLDEGDATRHLFDHFPF